MNAFEVRGLLGELVDENPFAVRAVLKVLAVEFTDTVPTLAVTIEERPRLLINLGFINEHCRTPEHVKAALCHELLHVLLRHTTIHGPLTPARHLALDAVINAIIHRQLGAAYSSLFAQYYKDAAALMRLLRPLRSDEQWELARTFNRPHDRQPGWSAWKGLHDGTVLADDIEQLACEFIKSKAGEPAGEPGGRHASVDVDRLLGNHADTFPLPDVLENALQRACRELNGGGIWRGAGPGANPYQVMVNPKRIAMTEWQSRTLAVLRKHLEPAAGAPPRPTPMTARLPVLSTTDRRAFLKATWSPFLPEAEWAATASRPEGRAQVYLDVSGSMNAEMPLIVALLGRMSRWIRRPFWAFSTKVVPAVIEGGVLKVGTSGGTSLECVLRHIEETRPSSAVIVTDGYVEAIPPKRIATALAATRLHAIVTRDGNPALPRKAGIPYSQLGRLPQ
jgi:hypothetical protein